MSHDSVTVMSDDRHTRIMCLMTEMSDDWMSDDQKSVAQMDE
jgi:hypothetical protein